MIRAVLERGLIRPIDPVPAEWPEGTELLIEEADLPTDEARLDRWYQAMEELVSECDSSDIEDLQTTLRQIDGEAKDLMRKEMGLV